MISKVYVCVESEVISTLALLRTYEAKNMLKVTVFFRI